MLCKRQGRNQAPFVVAVVDIKATCAEFENLLQHLDRAAKLAGAGEGSVQLGAPILRLACEFDAWKILAHEDFQIRKALIVFEVAIVLRLHVLDQAQLDQQRVDLAVGLEEVDIGNLAHQVCRAMLVGGRFRK